MHLDEQPTGIDSSERSEHSLARLLKLSGERETPSSQATAHAHTAALEVWNASLRQERSAYRRRMLSRIAAVLGIALIGAVTWISFAQRASLRSVAHVVTAVGETVIVNSDDEPMSIASGATVPARAQLRTRKGRAALSVGDSLSLRMNVDSTLRFDGENEITLLSGAIYVDSGGLSANSHLRILTPAGEVRHTGTQYQVAVTGQVTQIKVREGRVQLSEVNGDGAIHIVAGEEIRVDESGAISRRAVPPFGPDWEWASTLATPIDIDNRPLTEFLAWIVREHGWQLRYASAAEERAAQAIRLHGSAQGKTPAETLRRVSLITGLAMHVEDGVLLVGPSTGTAR